MSSSTLHGSLLVQPGTWANRDAILWPGGQMTHGELRSAALGIAGKLLALGIGTDDRVAICLPKSSASIQAICGILLCGAAYVPLDIFSPESRIGKILSDAEPRLVITNQLLERKIDQRWSTLVISESDPDPFLTWRKPALPEELPSVSQNALACLLYTSGSTGDPKGVMLSHRNISCFVNWAVDQFRITHEDRFANHAPLHFDLSTLDLFAPLLTGASVYLLDEKTARFPAAVARTLETSQISILYSVPSVLRSLSDTGILDQLKLKSLRKILFAGEIFPIAPLRTLMETLPTVDFVNLYGPTETNVCTFYELESVPEVTDREIPIGQACPHFQVLLLDDLGNGSNEGEICVSGPGVMLGYWRDTPKTEQSQLHGSPNSYRTGDFGWRDEVGNLHFRGRRDHQIKIRGQRIELLEIEAALARYPKLDQSAVVYVNSSIVAYVVLGDGSELMEASLRQHCIEHLPPYAVPSRFVPLDSLPETSTGKIDRVALKALAS